MSKRNLFSILQEMTETAKVAATNLDTVPYKNRASAAIAKNDAETKLKALREEYTAQLRERVLTIFVVGSKEDCAIFTKIATDEADVLSIDADAMYEKMAADVEPTIGAQRMFGGTQLQHLIRSLEQRGREANAGFLPVPRILDVVVVNPPVTTKAVVKDIIVSQIGVDLNARWIEAQIVELAIAAEYGEKFVPVVVTCENVDDAKVLKPKIFSGRGIGEALDKPVTVATVQETISRLKESLKKQ